MGYVSHIYSFCASSIFALYWITYGTEFTSGRHLTNNGVSVKWETTVKNKEALTARGITSVLHVPFKLKGRTIWKHRNTRNKFAISFQYPFHRIQGKDNLIASIQTSFSYVLPGRPVRPLRPVRPVRQRCSFFKWRGKKEISTINSPIMAFYWRRHL